MSGVIFLRFFYVLIFGRRINLSFFYYSLAIILLCCWFWKMNLYLLETLCEKSEMRVLLLIVLVFEFCLFLFLKIGMIAFLWDFLAMVLQGGARVGQQFYLLTGKHHISNFLLFVFLIFFLIKRFNIL